MILHPNDDCMVYETSFTVFPQDTNYMYPMLFGGKLLSEMDIAAALTCRRVLYKSEKAKDAVTVGIKNVNFHHGAVVKDIIYLKARVIKLGIKSIEVRVDGWVEKGNSKHKDLKLGENTKLCDGIFTFCASEEIDPNGTVRPIAHGLSMEEKD